MGITITILGLNYISGSRGFMKSNLIGLTIVCMVATLLVHSTIWRKRNEFNLESKIASVILNVVAIAAIAWAWTRI